MQIWSVYSSQLGLCNWEIIEEYGAEGYPFTAKRIDELRAKEEAIRAAQTVESLLLSNERDFVLAN